MAAHLDPGSTPISFFFLPSKLQLSPTHVELLSRGPDFQCIGKAELGDKMLYL